MRFLTRLFFTWLAVILAADWIDGVHVRDYMTALVAAAVLSGLNAFVKPLLVFLTLPITLVTLGFFLLALNAGVVLIGARLVEGFEVEGFWPALWFSLLVSLVVTLLEDIDRRLRKE
ncbi:MAG: phage holin family protein [Bacteroidetes bacterium]|nr:phage holin family protein [Bacteroidota bacterium]